MSIKLIHLTKKIKIQKKTIIIIKANSKILIKGTISILEQTYKVLILIINNNSCRKIKKIHSIVMLHQSP